MISVTANVAESVLCKSGYLTAFSIAAVASPRADGGGARCGVVSEGGFGQCCKVGRQCPRRCKVRVLIAL